MKKYMFILAMILTFALCGCGEKKTEDTTEVEESTSEGEKEVVHEELERTSVLTGIDLEKNEMFFRDCVTGEDRRLEYHGGVGIQNTYDKEVLVDNLTLGDVYDVRFYDDTKRLINIRENSAAVTHKQIEKFSADKTNNKAMYKGTTCKMSKYIVAFDNNEIIDVSEVNKEDEITITFYGDKLVSVVVDKGHGYVRLVNHGTYVGGMVEIGYDVVVPVTNDMLVTVREGDYTLRINKGSFNNSKRVNVIRNRESMVDISDIAVPSGVINFVVTPEEALATLYVEDVEYDGLAFTGVYGTSYSFVIKAEGYKDYKGSVKVSEPLRDYEVKLTAEGSSDSDKDKDKDKESTTDSATDTKAEGTVGEGTSETGAGTTESTRDENGSQTPASGDGTGTTGEANSEEKTTSDATSEGPSADSTSTTSSTDTTEKMTNNKITIKEPTGVGVYLDGDYVGTTPVTFPKTVGTHTITLYQKGYLIKSYTIQATDNGKDDEYKYPALISLEDALNKSK